MKMDMDISREIKSANLDSKILEKRKPLSRFIITSGLVHLITASAIVITNHVPKNEVEKEFVMIDVSAPADANSAPTEALLPEQVAKSETPAEIPQQEEQTQEEATPAEEAAPVVEEKPAPKPVAEKIPAPAVAKQLTSAPKPPPTKPIPVVKQTQSSKPVVAATVSDIETPTLDESAVPVKVAKQNDELKAEDLDQDLAQVDEQHDKKLLAAQNELDENTQEVEKSIAQATDSAAEDVKKENEIAAAQIKERSEALRKEEAAKAAALAEAQAKADALAKKQAADQARAEKLAAEKAAADKLAAEKAQEGNGQKDAGPGPVSTEVRALENLRQMPGNPKPQYDSEERLRGDKGVVVFQAYVSQSGSLSDFKMLQSSGHRNLDGKTLKALKQWKFYPGQEGFVELPFDWNLKGGPQEMPAFLRRKSANGR